MADRLSGTEVEEWFRKFARETSIISKLDCSPEILVRILNKEVKERFEDALVFVDARIPSGTTWINEILSGRITGNYSDSERQFLSDYLLDKVFATDVLIDIKDNQGVNQKLAVDVTTNAPKETSKLDKIQGKPNKKDDHAGLNRNVNMPAVRKLLGIDKHIVVTLSNERSELPSYDYLLNQLQYVTNAKVRTLTLNLEVVPESERLGQTRNLDSRQMWDKYSEGIQGKDKIEISKQVSLRAIRAGYDQPTVIEMLKHDPQYQRLAKSKPEIADNYPMVIYVSARERFELDKTKNPVRQEINIQALKMGRYIVQELGKENASGEKVAPGKLLTMRQKGKDLRIEATGDKRAVVEYKAGLLKGNPTSAELEWLKGWTNAIQADKQRSIQKPKDPGFER